MYQEVNLLSELIKTNCLECGSIIGVLKKEGTNEEAKGVADKIANDHCRSDSGRRWMSSKSIKKRPKVDMTEFDELLN